MEKPFLSHRLGKISGGQNLAYGSQFDDTWLHVYFLFLFYHLLLQLQKKKIIVCHPNVGEKNPSINICQQKLNLEIFLKSLPHTSSHRCNTKKRHLTIQCALVGTACYQKASNVKRVPQICRVFNLHNFAWEPWTSHTFFWPFMSFPVSLTQCDANSIISTLQQ